MGQGTEGKGRCGLDTALMEKDREVSFAEAELLREEG